MRYRSANKTVFSAKYHFLFCPKYRRKLLAGRVETRLKETRLRREFPYLRRLLCVWSPSWFVSMVGGAPLHVVRRYVENQRQAA
jgi:putative transposase